MAVLTSADKCFKIDGVLMSFNSRDVTPLANGVRFTNKSSGQAIDVPVAGTTLNGVPATNVQSILTFVEQYFFSLGGGSGGGAVESVTGSLVSGNSSNPVINNPLLESHQVIITDGSTRSLTDFNGTLFLVTNGIDPAVSATFNWNGLDDNTRKLTIVFTFDLPAINHTAGTDVTIRRLPTSAKIGDVWTAVYDKFYDTWDLASSNQVGTDRQVQGFVGGETKPVIIGVPHLTDIGGFPSFSNGVLTATAMNAATQTGLLSFIEFSTNTPKVGTFAMYTTGGRMPVSDAVVDGEAFSLGQSRKYNGFTEVNSNIILGKVHADRNKPILCTGGTPLVFAIPTNASVSWVVGDVIEIYNNHGAILTIDSSVVSLSSEDDMKVVIPRGWCKLVCISANQWQLIGSLTIVE